MALEHDAYTPTSIRHTEIIYGDRPFAAVLLLKTFAMALNSNEQTRITSALSTGIIGESAGGEWMQKSIHKALHNIQPLGWEHQIRNDIAINYEINYEKLLYSYKHLFSLNYNAQLRAGTLNDKASIGLTIMTGHFDLPFKMSDESDRKIKLYFYDQPLVSGIAYDATLQGGVFNHTSPYTKSANDITRITFQNNAGIVLSYRKIYLEYSQTYLTKEFNSGKFHRWGGVSVGVYL